MTLMTKLKLSNITRTRQALTVEESLRARMLGHLGEQQELIAAELKGETLVKTRKIYVTNDAGERVTQDAERRLRKWYWQDADGTWYLELRYGGKVMNIEGDKAAIEAGKIKDISKIIDTVIDAVKAGELDGALLTAKKERVAILRRTQ